MVFFAFVSLARCDVNLMVKTNTGIVKGTRNVAPERPFRIFYGIPYAQPPVGRLRFQAPVPVKSWKGVRGATEPPPKCVQPLEYGVVDAPVVGQEDCLYLNVYVPSILNKAAKKVPVIVFIHGGAFQFGSGADYHPDYFMERNVIFVTVNHRLGVIGFLGMNNDVISGNFGLKDLVLALKWIKENIAAFGGDPDNISLMGASSGAVAVQALMFSPLSKGLFHKAIMQSASVLGLFAFYDDATAETLNKNLLSKVGCTNEDPNEMLMCLQRVSAVDLVTAESELYTWDAEPTVLFKLTIESNVSNQPFLRAIPNGQNYVTKDIPMIIGVNSGEGIFKAARYLANGGKLVKIINSDRKRLLPLINQYLYTAKPDVIDNITQKVNQYYFGNKEIGFDTASKLVEMINDSTFTFPLVKTVLTYSGRRYVYYYDHQGSYSFAEEAGLSRDLGVGHGDEIPMLFRNEVFEKRWTPQDKRVSGELLKFWVNFATYADPSGLLMEKVWTPVETDNIEYLYIGSDSTIMKKNHLKVGYKFWQSLPLLSKENTKK